MKRGVRRRGGGRSARKTRSGSESGFEAAHDFGPAAEPARHFDPARRGYTWGMTRFTLLSFLLAALLLAALTGCSRMRFVVDLVPADDGLTETVVHEDDDARWRSPKVALIDVTGLIADVRRPGLLTRGVNPVAEYVESLRRAEDDSRVKAIIVRINSPGGTVTASDVVYRETVRFRERSGKPVVVLMGDVAASGGYYLACAADRIVAHPTTVTGSIGVIMQTFNFSEGMRRIGIHADAIVSGEKKAAGSPFEPMEPEHRALLQNMVNEFYDNFITTVTTNRTGLSDEQINTITDGRVVTGRQAHELGLIDEVGDLYTAFDTAKELAGLPAARLVKYHRALQHVGSAYAESPTGSSSTQLNLMQLNLDGAAMHDQPNFFYLWDPTIFSAVR